MPRLRFIHYFVLKSSSPHCQEVNSLQHWIYLMLICSCSLRKSLRNLLPSIHTRACTNTRLPFGVASAPAIFQRTMDATLQGLPMVYVYLDDILVSTRIFGQSAQSINPSRVSRLMPQREKCSFCQLEVTDLEHIISANGLKPSTNKIRAVSDLLSPLKIPKLKTFSGMVNYYAKFFPDLASQQTIAPLYKLFKHEEPWNWSTEQETPFQNVKKLLLSSHFDDTKPIIMACDASPFGVGAILSQIQSDGSEHPVTYVSHSLIPAKQNYSHLDKEALAIIFGVGKFRQYISGRTFILYTDHKPLIHIFNESKSIPVMASARLQRWALTLQLHYYVQVRKAAKQCWCSKQIPPSRDASYQQTDHDPILSKVKHYTQSGWPETQCRS